MNLDDITKKNLAAIAHALPGSFMKSLNVSQTEISSPRSVKFRVPGDNPAGVNQIKVTKTDTGFSVKFLQVVEVEVLDDIPAETLPASIKNVMAGKASLIDVSAILGKAAGK